MALKKGKGGLKLSTCSMKSCERFSFKPALPFRPTELPVLMEMFSVFSTHGHWGLEMWLVASMLDGTAKDRSQTLPAHSLPNAVLSEVQASLTHQYILLEHPPHA